MRLRENKADDVERRYLYFWSSFRGVRRHQNPPFLLKLTSFTVVNNDDGVTCVGRDNQPPSWNRSHLTRLSRTVPSAEYLYGWRFFSLSGKPALLLSWKKVFLAPSWSFHCSFLHLLTLSCTAPPRVQLFPLLCCGAVVAAHSLSSGRVLFMGLMTLCKGTFAMTSNKVYFVM